MKQELARIEEPGYGLRDNDQPCLWFKVNMITGCSLQVFFGDEADKVITTAGVYDVKDLAGKACVVRRDHGRVEFVRMHK